jgi:hypothetical protein
VIVTSTYPSLPEIQCELASLREGSAAVLVRGLPVGDGSYHHRVMDAVAAVLGPPRRYPASRYGSGAVHDMADPAPSLACTGLDWHTEDSYAPVPPAFVALLCIKGDSQVRTHLCRLNGPGPQAAAEGVTLPDPYLYGNRPATKLPLAFHGDRGTGWRYDPALITPGVSGPGLCPVIVEAQHDCLVLEDGDLLVFDNHALTHARDGHGPEGSRRLLRMILD